VCLCSYGHVVLMLRPGNAPLPPSHGFPTAHSLAEITQLLGTDA
jgi:hypothetical protein